MNKIVNKINKLEEVYAHKTLVEMDYQEKRREIEKVIAPQLLELDAEYSPLKEQIATAATELEAEIKADVLKTGETVKGNQFTFAWVKGRVSWDTKALDGYAAGHPEIAQFRKEGEPSVTFRK